MSLDFILLSTHSFYESVRRNFLPSLSLSLLKLDTTTPTNILMMKNELKIMVSVKYRLLKKNRVSLLDLGKGVISGPRESYT